jgi:mono/diheme cytochrome c family protein
MRNIKLALLASAAALSLLACAGSTNTDAPRNAAATPAATQQTAATPARPTSTPDELAAAAADYSQFCIRCHKADGTGGDFDNDGEIIKVPNLREHGRRDSDASLANHIANGGKKMPPFKNRLSPERIEQLVRYVRREFHGAAPAAAR